MSTAIRDLILAGAEPRPFAVPALGGATVLIRALRMTEAAEVRALQVSGIRLSGATVSAALAGDIDTEQVVGQVQRRERDGQPSADGLSIDLSALVAADGRAVVAAVAYGLVEPALTREEIEVAQNPMAIEQIGREILRRSGLGRGQAREIATFRPERRGPDDAGPAPDGDAPGGDPAGPDPGPA